MTIKTEAIITLDFPVTNAGASYSTLTMRRPTGADYIEKDKHELSEPNNRVTQYRFFSSLCSVPEAVIYAMDELADIVKLYEALDSFLPTKAADAGEPKTSDPSPPPSAA